MNRLKELNNKKICLLGLGAENAALADFLLVQNKKLDLTVCDSRSEKELAEKISGFKNKNIDFKLGKDYDKNLDKFDVIFRSPGYPLFKREIAKAAAAGVKINSPIKIFFELCPTKNIIGITGTKGKGTTSSLIYEILKKAGKKVRLGGNIGIAPFGFINKIGKDSWVVLELSSFQLEDLARGPKIAVITNFSRDHLSPADPNNPNYHKNMKDYWEAKANIFKHQRASAYLVANEKLAAKTKNVKIKSKMVFFGKSGLKTRLRGEHNKENIAAAVETAKILKIKPAVIAEAIKSFRGLPHRLEFAGRAGGVEYYNDSFATTPDSAITALKSFKSPIILLAGGADKGSDFGRFAREIKRRAKFVVLFRGKGSERIKKELVKVKYRKNRIRTAGSMAEAFTAIKKELSAGDIVLLSPGCASFGVFNNYKERGNFFKAAVKK